MARAAPVDAAALRVMRFALPPARRLQALLDPPLDNVGQPLPMAVGVHGHQVLVQEEHEIHPEPLPRVLDQIDHILCAVPPDHALVGELHIRSRRALGILQIAGHACTPVRVGPSDLTQTLILEGLQSGDVVVVGPYKVLEKIKDGEAMQDEREAAIETVDRDEDATDPDAAAEGSEGA